MGVLQSISDHRFGTGAELAVGATRGFVHLPRIAGAPTAAPHSSTDATQTHRFTDTVPVAIETTTGRLWAWAGGGSGNAGWSGAFSFKGAWTAGVWNKGDAVSYDAGLYVCTARRTATDTTGPDSDSSWTLMVTGGKASGLPGTQSKGYLYASSNTAALTWKDLVPTKELLPNLPNNNSFAGRVLRVNTSNTPSAYWASVGTFLPSFGPTDRRYDILGISANDAGTTQSSNRQATWLGLSAVMETAVWQSTAYGNSSGVLQIHLNSTAANSATFGSGHTLGEKPILKIGFTGGSGGEFLQRRPGSAKTYQWSPVLQVPSPTTADGNDGKYLKATGLGTYSWQTGTGDVDSRRLLPAGGTNGQVLKKTAGTDYSVGWAADEEGDGDFDPDNDPTVTASQNQNLYLKKTSTGYLWAVDRYANPRTLSDATPLAADNMSTEDGAAGTESEVSRRDHIHPIAAEVSNDIRGSVPAIENSQPQSAQAGKVLKVSSNGRSALWARDDKGPEIKLVGGTNIQVEELFDQDANCIQFTINYDRNDNQGDVAGEANMDGDSTWQPWA